MATTTAREASPICLYVLGPSGVGKSTLAHALQDTGDFARVLPVMTRARRPAEVDGEDGLFLTEAEFRIAENDGELLAQSIHLGARYAFHRRQVRNALATGATPLVEAYAPRLGLLRATFMAGPAVLLLPSTTGWLEERIRRRGAPPREVEFRMARVHQELQWLDHGGIDEVDEVIEVTESTSVNTPAIVRRVRQACGLDFTTRRAP